MTGRGFDLVLPHRPSAGQGRPPGLRGDPVESLRVETAEDLYIPRVLERDGLARYEPETLALYLALLERRSGGTVFDVGANVGVFALLAAALTDWLVVAFEPVPRLAAVARRLTTGNHLDVEVEEIALGRTPGTATLYLSAVTDSSNSLREGFRPAEDTVEVPVETLDGYAARTGRTPDLLKIDTETTEPDVLRGAGRLLDEHRPWIICEVLAGRTEDELAAILPRHGYRPFHITDRLPPAPAERLEGDREHRFNNWLFAPEPPQESLWDGVAHWRQALTECQPWGRSGEAFSLLERPALAWGDPHAPDRLAQRWRPRSAEPRCLPIPEPDGWLRVQCSLTAQERFYLSHGQTPFEHPPADAADWPVEGGHVYRLEVEMERLEGDARVHLWAIRYDRDRRLEHDNRMLRPGANGLVFRTAASARTLRVALRFSGTGVVRLGPLRLSENR